ncbi:uncharacterized protein LOC134092513 isoform X2 [Sardina pilchardus]|uniref:uncharacterized protein LOC134092511 isoform X2 n=1 Tax=Sardina pilchardus TaxID=27697 RepID=UPI002E1031B9
MGNTVSCCCRANPGDRQEEEQRSRHEGSQSQQTSVEVLEGGSVTPRTTSADSFDSPLFTNEEGTSQSRLDLPLEILQQLKPSASTLATNIHVEAASAVYKSKLRYQEELAAAGLVSEVLTTSKLLYQQEVAAAGLVSEVLTESKLRYQQEVAAAGLVSEVLTESKLRYQQELAAAGLVSEVLTESKLRYQQELAAAGLVSEVLTESKLRYQQELAAAGLVSEVLTESKLRYQQEVAASGLVSEVLTESKLRYQQEVAAAGLVSAQLDKNVQSKGAPFAKLYTGFHFMERPESLGCSLKVRKMPLLMTPIKETLSELHQLVASLNGSAHDSAKDMKLREELCHGERMNILSSFKTDEAGLAEIRDSAPHVVFGLSAASSLGNLVEPKDTSVRSPISKQDKLRLEAKSLPPTQVIKWLVLMERPLSLGPITLPAVKLENRLVQNPSTEVVVNDAPKGQSTSPYSEEVPDQDQDQYSFGPPVDISVYSESEWKGQTIKSIVIRKGYAVLSQCFGFLRRVKADNYCALRASLYQALMHTNKLPYWLQQKSILLIPEQLESRYGLIKGWLFPDTCKHTGGIDKSVGLLKCYLRLLQNWWHAAAASPGVEGRRSVCEQLFQGGEDEFGVIEALKLLMLAHAVDLHAAKQRGDNVPIFCWLLFARDTSSSPRSYLANHLSQVGFSRGMEQVDMFLLSCAMRLTIKVYRLHMAETEEFISFYPDDSIQDGHCVCLATEDDRHYNVAFGNPVYAEEDLSEEYD